MFQSPKEIRLTRGRKAMAIAAVVAGIGATVTQLMPASAAVVNTSTACASTNASAATRFVAFSSYSFQVNGVTKPVTDSRDVSQYVFRGNTVSFTFVLKAACDNTYVGASAYQNTGPVYDPATAAQQKLVDRDGAIFSAGVTHLIAVHLPTCFYQFDINTGGPYQPGDDKFDAQGRLLLAGTGGEAKCTPPATTPPTLVTTPLPPVTVATIPPVTVATVPPTTPPTAPPVTPAPPSSPPLTGTIPPTVPPTTPRTTPPTTPRTTPPTTPTTICNTTTTVKPTTTTVKPTTTTVKPTTTTSTSTTVKPTTTTVLPTTTVKPTTTTVAPTTTTVAPTTVPPTVLDTVITATTMPPAAPTPTLATTGLNLTPFLAGGAALVAFGAGFVFLARRKRLG